MGILSNTSYILINKKNNIHPKLIQHTIFMKQYNKIYNTNKIKYVEINNNFILQFKQFFDSCIDLYKKYIGANLFSTNKLYDGNLLFLDTFSRTDKLPKSLESLEYACEYYTSITSKLLDIYVIGRLLKPYVKNGIIYVGAAHGQNIVRILTEYFNFKVISNAKDIIFPMWKNITNNYNSCTNTTDVVN